MDYRQLTEDYHFSNLPEEAQVKMVVAKAAFDGVKDRYRGLRRFKRNIEQEDIGVLNSCLALLLPLTAADGDTSIPPADLIMQIAIYQARFRNTEVKAYRVSVGLD